MVLPLLTYINIWRRFSSSTGFSVYFKTKFMHTNHLLLYAEFSLKFLFHEIFHIFFLENVDCEINAPVTVDAEIDFYFAIIVWYWILGETENILFPRRINYEGKVKCARSRSETTFQLIILSICNKLVTPELK